PGSLAEHPVIVGPPRGFLPRVIRVAGADPVDGRAAVRAAEPADADLVTGRVPLFGGQGHPPGGAADPLRAVRLGDVPQLAARDDGVPVILDAGHAPDLAHRPQVVADSDVLPADVNARTHHGSRLLRGSARRVARRAEPGRPRAGTR